MQSENSGRTSSHASIRAEAAPRNKLLLFIHPEKCVYISDWFPVPPVIRTRRIGGRASDKISSGS
jgi:hypothetical protein